MGSTATSASDQSVQLPVGVWLRPLTTHPDDRGDFTEFFRNEWYDSPLPVQWNISRSRPNVLRGVHVHVKHWDYYCVVDGETTVGLHDLRADAALRVRSAMVRLGDDRLEVLAIPPGVAHGVYSQHGSTLLIGVSGYYDPADHRRCRWNCPELDLDWRCQAPELSQEDRQAPGYAELRSAFLAAMASVETTA